MDRTFRVFKLFKEIRLCNAEESKLVLIVMDWSRLSTYMIYFSHALAPTSQQFPKANFTKQFRFLAIHQITYFLSVAYLTSVRLRDHDDVVHCQNCFSFNSWSDFATESTTSSWPFLKLHHAK